MIPLTKLKKDVQFNTELTKVVDVLKGVAAARFHILERQIGAFEDYFTVVGQFLELIDWSKVTHPFVQASQARVGAVLVTSNAGFLGGLNTQVINLGMREAQGDAGVYTVIGERGATALRGTRLTCTFFPGIEDGTKRQLAAAVRTHIVQQVLEGTCGRLVIVYPRPVSFAVQEVTMDTLLPSGAWAPPPSAALSQLMLWESEPADVAEYLVIQWLGHRLSQVFSVSRLAELSARVVHLEGSYQELQRLGKKLKHEYHRARHEVIDRSMREIFAAQLLYGGAHE
jgi:ATP synthase F1 gamma subunit